MKRRVKLIFVPKFKGPIEGWVVNFLRRNYWRVERTMEYEDAMQEARLVFCKLIHKYPTIDTPQHFMSLFQTAWRNHFNDLTTADTSSRCLTYEAQMTDADESPLNVEGIGELDNAGMLTVMLKQAPQEVNQVLALFVSAPTELLGLARMSWKRSGKYREDGNKMINELLGRPHHTDSIGAVERYFANTTV